MNSIIDQNQIPPNFEVRNEPEQTNEISRENDHDQTNTNTVTNTNDKNIIFNCIINEIDDSNENEWIKSLIVKIYDRFSRMPNGWWPKIKNTFNQKFNHNYTLTEIKNLSSRLKQRSITSTINDEQNTNIASQTYNSNISNVVLNTKLYTKVKDSLLLNIDKYCQKQEIKERTKKVYGPDCNKDVIEYLNMVLESENIKQKIDNIKQYNNLVYACQKTYDDVTQKPRKESNWKQNIMKKIDKFETKLNIINNHDQTSRPSKEMIKLCKENNIHTNNSEDIQKLKDSLFEKKAIYEKKISISNKRIAYRKENKMFEFNRRNFYRNLDEEKCQFDPNISNEELKLFWNEVWKNNEDTENFDDLVNELEPITENVEITDTKIKSIVESNLKFLSNWKTPGKDYVYNFFIKKIYVLHEKLAQLIVEVINNPDKLDEEFYTGVTYLLPKKQITSEPKDTRPITCLPNIYKLISKCITTILNEICDLNEIISSNQMGTINKCQGAKEQALINKNLNSKYDNKLFTSWIDIKKAYDSVNHLYILKCLERLKIPINIIKFVERTLKLQKTDLMFNQMHIGSINIKKGIMQGDGLSPKLFVLAMEPLSRILNRCCEKLHMNESNDLKRNHLIFIDDIKLLSDSKQKLENLCDYTKSCLKKMGFVINTDKSKSNIESDNVFGENLNGTEGYKYLGILENSENIIKEENKTKITGKILSRVSKLCQTKLNAYNLFYSLNEFAISTINYYIGLVPFEPKEFELIDTEIKRILYSNRIIKKSANNDRLYLKRNELGRGLTNINEKSETSLFNLITYLENSIKRKPIADEERRRVTHLGLIKEYLTEKYDIEENALNIKEIQKKQKEKRMKKISDKSLHGVLFKNEDNIIDVNESSKWLKNGNISPQEEGMLCGLQDRNLFYKKEKCNHCNHATKSVDHLATQCGRMLNYDYKKRHNDVVRCLHFLYTKKYGLNKNNKLKNYKVENVLSNERVRIKSDVTIETETRIEHNKPDLFIHDLRKKEITIIEVGITNKNILSNVELTKSRKYELLGKELSMMYHNAKVTLIPIVITWDGLVTKYFKKYIKMIGVSKNLQAYVQNLVIKRTCESVMIDYRQGVHLERDEMEEIFHRMEDQTEEGRISQLD